MTTKPANAEAIAKAINSLLVWDRIWLRRYLETKRRSLPRAKKAEAHKGMMTAGRAYDKAMAELIALGIPMESPPTDGSEASA